MSKDEFQEEIENLTYFLIFVGMVGFVTSVSSVAAILWQNKFTLFLMIVCMMVFVVFLSIYFIARNNLKAKQKTNDE